MYNYIDHLTSFALFVVQSFVFCVAIFLCFKSRARLANALVLFWVVTIAKLVFGLLWVTHQTGDFEINYLQYPDESFYLLFQPGGDVRNIYSLLVYYLGQIGFDVFNIKYLNILLTSFALVRLYSLDEYVEDKQRYYYFLLFFGGLSNVYVIYFSVFVLKDAIILTLVCELFVQLILRPIRSRNLYIVLLILLLVLFRKQLVLFFVIFVFDSSWKIRWYRVMGVFSALIVVALSVKTNYFVNYISIGVYRNLGEGGYDVKRFPGFDTYLYLIMKNIEVTLSPFAQKDIVNVLILSSQWIVMMFLLKTASVLRCFLRFWPIMLAPILHFAAGIFTYYNIRYNLAVSACLLFTAIFVASGVRKELLDKLYVPKRSVEKNSLS